MQKPVTMRMLAKELGLSLSAVSKALNDYPDIGPETKALVLNKAAELGYSPNILARNLARKTSDFVGVVIRDITSIYGEMFKSLNAAARQYGLHLILYDTDNDRAVEKQCIQNLIDGPGFLHLRNKSLFNRVVYQLIDRTINHCSSFLPFLVIVP